MDNEILLNLSTKYETKPAHILLNWARQQNLNIIPRSKDTNHIIENFNFKNMNFSIDDILLLDSLDENYATHPQYL
jgi:diketogulonate reductase-like aldo/keto reductase